MKLRKLVLLMFMAAGLFATSQLSASANKGFGDCLYGECCIGSGGACPQSGRECCAGYTCQTGPGGGGGTSCR